jgi:hypothetical protein
MVLALNDTDRFCDVSLVKASLGDSSGTDLRGMLNHRIML